MKRPFPWIFLLLLVLLTAFHIWGIAGVPFHPDESSWLYMSRDFEQFLSRPTSLIWDPALEDDYDQTYRLLNAPLAKYVLGLARAAAGYPASSVSVDWDWSKSWESNLNRGAHPEAGLLGSARLAVTLFFPLSLIFIYLVGKRVGGEPSGVLAALLLGLNPLVLLHGRRAMAEGVLVFGVVFGLWTVLQADRRPWLAGLGAALAASAKYSAAALLPVGLLAAIWTRGEEASRWRRRGVNALQYALASAALIYALHPLIWKQPIQAGIAMLESRWEFSQEQFTLIAEIAPEKALRTPGQRAGVLLAHLYLTEPAVYDVGNYAENTSAAEKLYFSNPGHNLLRGVAGGGLLLVLTLAGMAFSGLRAAREPARRRDIALLGAAFGAQALALAVTIPIPVQRYVMPLVPLVALWTGLALGILLDTWRGREE